MKEVVSEIDLMITSSTQEMIMHNKCQTRFLENSVLKRKFDKNLIINAITWSMLESLLNSDDDDMDNGVSKSTILEHTIKNLMKETIFGSSVTRNLVRRGQNIRA